MPGAWVIWSYRIVLVAAKCVFLCVEDAQEHAEPGDVENLLYRFIQPTNPHIPTGTFQPLGGAAHIDHVVVKNGMMTAVDDPHTRTTLTDITGDANLGTALSNDHPVGFDYAAVVAADAEIQATTLPLYNGDMWCSTCHDVHDNTDTPFLQAANGGSALCLTCHIK